MGFLFFIFGFGFLWAAESLGLSLIKPYLSVKNESSVTSIEEGVNFAVAGATALDIDFFIERGIYSVSTNYSLRVQLDWFKEILPYLCNTSSSKFTIQSSSSVTFLSLLF
jgi:hypothetical protein